MDSGSLLLAWFLLRGYPLLWATFFLILFERLSLPYLILHEKKLYPTLRHLPWPLFKKALVVWSSLQAASAFFLKTH